MGEKHGVLLAKVTTLKSWFLTTSLGDKEAGVFVSLSKLHIMGLLSILGCGHS